MSRQLYLVIRQNVCHKVSTRIRHITIVHVSCIVRLSKLGRI